MGKQTAVGKGYKMEELLRSYFLKSGYFVVRGVPFVYESFDVTDIDLWLYGRASSVSREITIVDIKNKKTPQAIERIFWVQGLKQATKATNAVVATTDKRQEVKDFGRELGVQVLDGSFLDKLNKTEDPLSGRLLDEDFFSKVSEYALGKLDGDWKGRIISSKGLLSKGLSFDSCNEWLNHARFFAEQVITKPMQREIALRCLYIICSFVAIAIDYLMRELSFLDTSDRVLAIKDGFTYGSKGSGGVKRIINISMGLVEQYASDGAAISNQVRAGIERQFASLPTTILGDYFAKTEVTKSLFSVGKEFELLAMQKLFATHSAASVELRSMLSCLLDYWGINRVEFSEQLKGS
jgi:hypothetical protein